MKVSVIVPVYNKEQYIRACIDSLVAQTYRDIEIILVDDESTDASGAICDEYALLDKRVKVLHASGEGPAAACKTGTEAASGDYACFVDSDDWVDAEMIERLADHISGTDNEIILSDYVIERQDGTRTYVYQDIEPGEYGPEDIINRIFPKLWGIEDRAVSHSRCMKLYSMDLVRRNIDYPDPDLKFAEDGAFLLPCVMDAKRLFFLDHAAMYHYRYVTDSAVHRYNPDMTENIERIRGIINRAITDKFGNDPDMEKRMKELYRAESVIMMTFAIKNELRGEKQGCATRICNLCRQKENAELIKKYPVKFRQSLNRLIYHTMKHPSGLKCAILKSLMDIHEKRQQAG
ncbi:MAG: glycosyltransferase [Lachnospiraceae bacterium]|nr:glycosyltransferase [Lachnospiraceae bacterium]